METIANDLVETGFTEGFELCHFRAQRGMRVDGYWFNDEESWISSSRTSTLRNELASLTRTGSGGSIQARCQLLRGQCQQGPGRRILEVTSPVMALQGQIADRRMPFGWSTWFSVRAHARRQNSGSSRCGSGGCSAAHHIWDISRLHRQRSSRSHKGRSTSTSSRCSEGASRPPSRTHLGTDAYQSI